jgi:hypothetical protein
VADSSDKSDTLAVASSDSPESSGRTTETEASTTEHDDVALIHGRTEDGRGLKILRRRQDRLELGAVVPLVPGKPIVGEIVRLEPRSESPLLCNVHVEYTPPAEARATSAGPAQVASERYRENWESATSR